MYNNKESEIMVSVCCIAYNHEKYIKDALNGFIMQKTTFKYEVLINDDASPDCTADIIRKYTSKYPDIIRPIYQTENQYSKGVKIIGTILIPLARGKYIAICEGDDYWTNPNKLQFQVDFLESHPEYAGMAHNVRYLNDPSNEVNINKELYGPEEDRVYSLDSFVNHSCIFGHPCSLLFRNFFTEELIEKMKSPEFPGINHIEIGFWLGLMGGIYYSKAVMATNRYIMNRNYTNWRSQVLTKNILGTIYNFFPRLEKMAYKEFGVKVDLSRNKEAHYKQMVLRTFKTWKCEDFSIMWATCKNSGKILKHIFLIPYTIVYNTIYVIYKTAKNIFRNK